MNRPQDDLFYDARGDSLPGLEEMERDLGRLADSVRFLGEGDLWRLHGGDQTGVRGRAPDLDLSKPGRVHGPDEEPYYFVRLFSFDGDGHWHTWGWSTDEVRCGEPWVLTTSGHRPVSSCDVADYRAYYRETLLRGMVEAHRLCAPTRCENALVWILSASWGCVDSQQFCIMSLAIICSAV